MATPHLRQRFLSHCYMDVGFPGGSDGKESTCNAGDPGLIPGWEDPLGKEMETHSSIPAWRIPWAEEPDRLQSMGSQRVGHDWATKRFHFLYGCRSPFCRMWKIHCDFVMTLLRSLNEQWQEGGRSGVCATRKLPKGRRAGLWLCLPHTSHFYLLRPILGYKLEWRTELNI